MVSSYKSMEPFEVRCRWWRPNSPSRRVPGTVGFDGTEVVAVLDEWMQPRDLLALPTPEIIHGETADGTAVTLVEAFVSTANSAEIRMIANGLGVGAHLLNLEEQAFSSATARIDGLDEWSEQAPIEVKNVDGVAEIRCAAPWYIGIDLPERSASFTIGQNRDQLGGGRRITIEYFSRVHVTPHQPQPINWFHGIITETRQLLTLFMNQDAGLAALSLVPEERDSPPTTVEWFWRRRESGMRKIRIAEILLPFGCLNGRLEQVLRNWFSKTDDLRHARALLFANLATPAPFLETRFLPMVQALEVYCRALGTDKYIPDTEFKELKSRLYEVLPSGLPTGLVQKLRSSIGFANETSLKDRIQQVIDSLLPQTRRFVCLDSEKFARELTQTRNYFTHYGESGESRLTGLALHRATERAALLLKIQMLKESGVDESLIESRLRSCRRHEYSVES